MKRIIILGVLLMAAAAGAQTYDDDGLLSAGWGMPVPQNLDTLSHFQAELFVNGSLSWANDSIPVPDTLLIDFYQLSEEGDQAVLKIRSVGIPHSYSVWMESDTCYYDTGSPINPPTGLHWIVDGLPSPPIRETDQR
jgi:hypothetical protein